jgi:hypothetical protein
MKLHEVMPQAMLFGGEMGPGWLLRNKFTRPDLMIAAGFSWDWK